MAETKAADKPLDGEFTEKDGNNPTRALATWSPKFVESMEAMSARREQNLEYMRRVLKEGVHYGPIPGTGKKPTLLKAGAQALCRDMNLHPDPVILEHIADVLGNDHDSEPFLSYNLKVDLYALRADGSRMWVGAGVGSCNSWEERYRWQTQVRKCPNCGEQQIIRGNPRYAPRDDHTGRTVEGYEKGGWLCWRKKGGCGTTFIDTAEAIVSQPIGKVPNERVMDLDNTIFKQGAKRALVEAVLNVTGASDVYTQDLDEAEEPDERYEQRKTPEPPKPAPKPISEADKTLIRDAYRFYQDAKIKGRPETKKMAGEVIDRFTTFMNGAGFGKWETLWERGGDKVAEVFTIFGIEKAPSETDREAAEAAKAPSAAEVAFDPDKVEVPA